MSQIITAHFEGDNGAVYLPLGFMPDFVLIIDYVQSTNTVFYVWFREMETEEASGYQEGITISQGATADVADGAGISAYNTASQGPTVSGWTTAVSTAATARTSTAHGAYVRPSTSSSTDRDAIFECVTAGTGGANEPTWPTKKGEQVTDGSTVWERVDDDAAIEQLGYQGIGIAASAIADGVEAYVLAIQADKVIDFGDVASWSGGVYGA